MTPDFRFTALLLASTMLFSPLAAPAFAGDPVELLTGGILDGNPDDEGLLQALPAPIELTEADKLAALATDLPAKAKVKGPDNVELAALYYYAGLKQEQRVEAEIRRLQVKYPGFVPPADLHADPATRAVSEQVLWSLYDKSDFAGIEAEIARLAQETPGWAPSQDFTVKLARKKLRAGIEQAVALKDWKRVIALGGKLDPDRESEVDLIWAVIDAQSALGNKAEAARFYRGILTRTDKPLDKAAIIATIQKATRDFSPDEVRAVIDRFSSDPDFGTGLELVRTDLVRREIAEFNADDTRKDKLPQALVDQLRTALETEGRIADMSLLGWYDLKVGDPVEAGVWFRKALDKEPRPDHAKGLYLALVRQDRQAEAYDIALAYRKDLESDPVFLMNALSERFGHPETGDISADAVKAYSTTILSTSSPEHAEILAWYAYNSGQYASAAAWFAKAVEWKPAEPRVKGLGLSYARMGAKAELVALYRRFEPDYPAIWDDIKLGKGKPARRSKKASIKVAEMVGEPDAVIETAAIARKPDFIEPEGDKAVGEPAEQARASRVTAKGAGYLAAFEAKRYSACLAGLQGIEAGSGLSADQSLIKGWCLLGLNRLAEARSAFEGAFGGAKTTRQDAAYGMALTFLRAKLTDDAEATITVYPLSASRETEVRAEILFQRARSAFDQGRYEAVLEALNARIALVKEPANLSQMRGWAHFNLGHKAEARAIFERLNMHMDDPAIRRGLGATGQDVTMAR